jgi:hypothetical protein
MPTPVPLSRVTDDGVEVSALIDASSTIAAARSV